MASTNLPAEILKQHSATVAMAALRKELIRFGFDYHQQRAAAVTVENPPDFPSTGASVFWPGGVVVFKRGVSLIKKTHFFSKGDASLFTSDAPLSTGDAVFSIGDSEIFKSDVSLVTGDAVFFISDAALPAGDATLFKRDTTLLVGDAPLFKTALSLSIGDAALFIISCVFVVGDASPLKSDEVFFAENRVFWLKTAVLMGNWRGGGAAAPPYQRKWWHSAGWPSAKTLIRFGFGSVNNPKGIESFSPALRGTSYAG